MGHEHIVHDTDARFIIDPVTRKIKDNSSKKITLIQYDHNSERFTFEIPKVIEGHDMSKCTEVEVHYFNIDSKTKKQNKGIYTVDDLQVDPENQDAVICSWLISIGATKLNGLLKFLLRYKCVDDNGVEAYAWNTAFFTGISVSEGSDADETFESDYLDVIEQWKASVMAELKDDLDRWKAITAEEVREEAFEDIAAERKRIDFLSNYVTPQMFGAKGDGVTDDTEAFQNAINNSKGLFVPDGVYLVSELRVSKPIRILGASKANAVLKYAGTGKALTIKPHSISSSNDCLQVELENMKIIADNAETAIYINETVHSVFRNLFIGGTFTKGFEMNGESNVISKYNSIYNNHFEEITIENCKHGFDIMGCISDTHFNLITIMRVDKGVYIHGEYDHQGSNNVTFTNSTIIWSKEAFEINGCHFRNIHISGCNFELFDNFGVKIDPVNSDVLNISVVNSFFMPSGNATSETVCLRLNKVSGGIINNLLFQNTINGVVGIDTTGSLLLHIDTLTKNNGSTIVHEISKACYYHSYAYENNLDNQVFSVGIKAPRITTTGGVAFWDGNERRSINFVNGHLMTTVDGQNCYVLAYMGTSVIKSLTNVKAGSCIMDGTLGKPVFYTGEKWVDAMGTDI